MSQSQWRHDPAIVNIWLKFESSHFPNIHEGPSVLSEAAPAIRNLRGDKYQFIWINRTTH